MSREIKIPARRKRAFARRMGVDDFRLIDGLDEDARRCVRVLITVGGQRDRQIAAYDEGLLLKRRALNLLNEDAEIIRWLLAFRMERGQDG